MTNNVHKVPAKQWRKWGDETRSMFNDLLPELAAGFENNYLPPSLHGAINGKQAYVLAWNASWQAACAMEKTLTETATANMAPL